MNQFLRVSRALSDETRIRILMALQGDELCLCQIIELLGLAPSTVSKHMTVVREAGLVRSRKEGRWHYFRLAGKEASPEVGSAIRWMVEAIAGDTSLEEDARNLKEVIRKEKEELCACYKR